MSTCTSLSDFVTQTNKNLNLYIGAAFRAKVSGGWFPASEDTWCRGIALYQNQLDNPNNFNIGGRVYVTFDNMTVDHISTQAECIYYGVINGSKTSDLSIKWKKLFSEETDDLIWNTEYFTPSAWTAPGIEILGGMAFLHGSFLIKKAVPDWETIWLFKLQNDQIPAKTFGYELLSTSYQNTQSGDGRITPYIGQIFAGPNSTSIYFKGPKTIPIGTTYNVLITYPVKFTFV